MINTISYAAEKIKSSWVYLETIVPATYNELNRVVMELVTNNNAIQALFDLKAPLANPALTGTPTTPTAADGTANAQIASTAFVNTCVNNAINWKPNTSGGIGKFQALVWDYTNHQLRLPSGGTWAYSFELSYAWSGGDFAGERGHEKGAGIAAGDTVLSANDFIHEYNGNSGLECHGGFCWRIA